MRVVVVLAGLALALLGVASPNETLTIRAPSPDDSPPWVDVHCGTSIDILRGDLRDAVPVSAEGACRSAGQRRLAVAVGLIFAGIVVGALGLRIKPSNNASSTDHGATEALVVGS